MASRWCWKVQCNLTRNWHASNCPCYSHALTKCMKNTINIDFFSSNWCFLWWHILRIMISYQVWSLKIIFTWRAWFIIRLFQIFSKYKQVYIQTAISLFQMEISGQIKIVQTALWQVFRAGGIEPFALISTEPMYEGWEGDALVRSWC